MPDPASLYALYYEIVRSGIDPFSDLAKECKSSKCQVNLKFIFDFGGVFFHPVNLQPHPFY